MSEEVPGAGALRSRGERSHQENGNPQEGYSHRTLAGSVLPHRMLSSRPKATWAQALSLAVRVASSRLGPEAMRQSFFPSNSMQTSQLTFPSHIGETRM
jgi:hypothetical protein